MAGDMRNLRQQRLMLTRLEKGRYSGDTVLDYLQNKDNKALIFTDRHVLYIDLKRQSVRWAFSLVHLFSVSSAGAPTHVTGGMLVCLCTQLNLQGIPLAILWRSGARSSYMLAESPI